MRIGRLVSTALLLALPCAAIGEVIWVVDTLDAAMHVGALSLAIDSSDGLHAALRDETTLQYGTFASGVWTTETIPSGGSWPCIAVTPSGDPTVSFSTADRLRFGRRNGGVWTTEIVDPTHTSGYVIHHGLDSQRHAYICSYDGGMSIYYATDVGGTWSVERLPGQSPDGGTITVGPDEKPRIAYPVYGPLGESDKLLFATRQGSEWQAETADSSSRSWHQDIQLTLGAGSLPRAASTKIITWTDIGYYSIQYNARTETGVWIRNDLDGVGHDPMSDQNSCGVMDLALDADGAPHVLYRKHIYYPASGEGPADTLFHAYKPGTSWVKEVVCTTPVRGASLVIDSNGRVEVLFGNYGPQYGLYLARRYDATGIAGVPHPAPSLRLSIAPNPIGSGGGTIFYALPGSGATVSIYDIRGRVIRSFDAGTSSGTLAWDGRDASGRTAATGAYFVRLTDGVRSETRRVTLVR
jgi:hypothetical protein